MVFASNIEKFIFYNFPIILFILLPLFLITGPFLSDLSISLISLLFLINCIRNNKFFYFNNKYFYFFLVFWFYLNFNSFINNFNLDSLKISFFFIRHGIFVIAIIYLIKLERKIIEYFFISIFICFLGLIIDGYYQYFFNENIFGWKSIRVSSFFGEEKILGSYVARLAPIFFGLFNLVLKKNKNSKYLSLFIFILLYGLVFISGERAAFFYINLSTLFIILLSSISIKKSIIFFSSSLVFLIIISFFKPIAYERMINITIKQMHLIKNHEENEKVYFFSREHTAHYLTAYRMFNDNKILGVGVKNFRNFCSNEKYVINKFSCSTHPHNTYIQFLSETGLIGFLFLLSLFFYFLFSVVKHLYFKFNGREYFTDFQIYILSGVLIYLWPLIPTGNFFNNWLNIMMIINLPFLISYKYDHNQ